MNAVAGNEPANIVRRVLECRSLGREDNVAHYRQFSVSHGRAIRPKAGLASISVYGQAFPEAAAYPSDIPAQSIVPLYAMSSGQTYVTSGTPPTDYFYDATINYSLPDDHAIVIGHDRYYQISFNHRQGFVKADDVDVLDF